MSLASPVTVAFCSALATAACMLPVGVSRARKNWLASAALSNSSGVGRALALLALAARGSAHAMLPGSFRRALNVMEHRKVVLWCAAANIDGHDLVYDTTTQYDSDSRRVAATAASGAAAAAFVAASRCRRTPHSKTNPGPASDVSHLSHVKLPSVPGTIVTKTSGGVTSSALKSFDKAAACLFCSFVMSAAITQAV